MHTSHPKALISRVNKYNKDIRVHAQRGQQPNGRVGRNGTIEQKVKTIWMPQMLSAVHI